MLIEALQTIVKANIDDASADVDASIDLAIQHLSNFFYLRKRDASLSASTNDETILKPDRSLKILSVRIGDIFIPKLDLDSEQAVEHKDTLRWYIEDDFISGTLNLIHLTKKLGVSFDGDPIVIRYLSGFTPLAGVAESSTDLPERLEGLLTAFATYFFYGILVSQIKNNKANFPNMTVWDVIAIWDTWRIHSNNLLKSTTKQKFNDEA